MSIKSQPLMTCLWLTNSWSDKKKYKGSRNQQHILLQFLVVVYRAFLTNYSFIPIGIVKRMRWFDSAAPKSTMAFKWARRAGILITREYLVISIRLRRIQMFRRSETHFRFISFAVNYQALFVSKSYIRRRSNLKFEENKSTVWSQCMLLAGSLCSKRVSIPGHILSTRAHA